MFGLHMKALTRARFRFVNAVSARPGIYYGLRHLTGMTDDLCLSDDTELVIEGYPRSANSSTVHRFLDRQPRTVRVAHHKHHAAQLVAAARCGKPAVVLVRRPVEAAISNLGLMAEGRFREGLDPFDLVITNEDVVLFWQTFYRAVQPILDHLVIAPFEEVTEDITPMIERINRKFSTNYQARPVDDPVRSTPLGWHAFPNEERDNMKRELRRRFDEDFAASPRLRGLVAACDEIYEDILGHYPGA